MHQPQKKKKTWASRVIVKPLWTAKWNLRRTNTRLRNHPPTHLHRLTLPPVAALTAAVQRSPNLHLSLHFPRCHRPQTTAQSELQPSISHTTLKRSSSPPSLTPSKSPSSLRRTNSSVPSRESTPRTISAASRNPPLSRTS